MLTKQEFRDYLSQGVHFLDGATGSNLRNAGMPKGCCTELWVLEHPEPLVGELYCKMKLQQLRPRVLVSYVREPYIYQAGNVRVTFDSHIRTSLFERDFAEGTPPDISATDAPGDTISEVKFDAFLPEVIRGLLQVGTLRQQAFSKYGACRRFG